MISKFQVGFKSLLHHGLSEPDFYGDLVYKLKKIVGSNNFSAQFIKIISHYKKIGYNIYVRGMFAKNCLFLSGDFKFQVSPKELISCHHLDFFSEFVSAHPAYIANEILGPQSARSNGTDLFLFFLQKRRNFFEGMSRDIAM